MRPSQEELLSFITERGYFEPKRRVNLQQLSTTLSTSKSNLSRKVRGIERYLAYEYIQKNKNLLLEQ
ncbi:MAG: helix-turn-helix domain-containing protein [Thermoplasmata archaeon]